MISDQDQKRCDVTPVGTFTDFVGVSIPLDEPHLFEFRQVVVNHLNFEDLGIDIVSDSIQWVPIAVVLWIVRQQRDEQLSPVWVGQRLENVVCYCAV